jgi:hypothetical protein
MLAIHALALAASTQFQASPTAAGNWAGQAWGPFNVAAALILLASLAYSLRRGKEPESDPRRLARAIWAISGVDLAITAVLAAVALDML